ncbi:hypothetical protein TBLA_0A09590 [Henningerozyma blattae CBS 6284]|uniref:Tryptophan--tRNA ligase, mitochondrial n=1 Tax=Henningerozyma blattae (strain ATCC 34711 / CBS 6284 / DSM 70876 / NBRC 10599 / NRRL Y-10934 / UCD 77-7) TaxID=1071380 RepID=I2GX91_HENB6|nr:hypothetical protein TBLA_0A09590 [Tetrapisispora blattae CBS 6284]CCH58743.1 hypothetical protein TBLA_0A09590 [Tetrapisispora blattae CBS 6284]
MNSNLRSPHLGRSLRYLSSSIQNTGFRLHADDLPAEAIIFSMIQPTGKFHLGNYLGATRIWKDMCSLKKADQQLFFGVADLHAITVPKPNPKEFYRYRREAIASILASGIDPSKSSVFYQSSLPEHSQLYWLLCNFSPLGSLNRMAQWKSKANIQEVLDDQEKIANVNLGLFAYPVLQAADILLYKATHVPVGDDQSPHLELTRTIATRFNKMYKTKYFPIPKTLLAPTQKILSLTNPAKKMSKSDPDQIGVLYLNDSPELISKKIKRAITDFTSDHMYYDEENRPGVSNLITIISGIQRKSIQEVEKDIEHFKNFKDFKNYVTEIIIEELKEPRLEFEKLINEPQYLDSVIEEGRVKAHEVVSKNISEIMEIMGYS